jgi:Bacterial archaeo-eukaryotic release factor family 2
VPTEELSRLYDANGPFLSLYLRTPGDVEDAARELDTRWRSTRRDLVEDGVPESVLEEVDPLVDGAYERGPGLAVIASVDGVLLADAVPEPPREVVVGYGPLPSIVPLLVRDQQAVANVVVLTDRTGAEIVARVPGGGDRVDSVEGRTGPHIHRSAPGGWSQPRYQHRAEHLWQANAAEVAEALTKVVDEVRPRVVAVAGDVRAVQLLAEQVPPRVSALIDQVGGEYPDVESLLRRADEAVMELVREDEEVLLARFAEERGQGDRAVDGPAAAVAALAKAQVETLLLVDGQVDGRTAWFGEEPTQIALDEAAIADMGDPTPVEAPLVDVLVRAAILTGADERVVGQGPDAPTGGVGALLRWSDPTVTAR